MTNRPLFLLSALASVALLPMCSEFDDVPPIGMVQATDPVADALMQKADAETKPGRKISVLEKLLNDHPLAPNAPEARFKLAQAYDQKKDYRESFKQYSKLIERAPQSPLYTKALDRQLEMAMDAAQGRLLTPVLFGAWHVEMDSKVVIEWLDFIVDKAPYNRHSSLAAYTKAEYLERMKRPEEAREAYRRYVERYPESPEAPKAQMRVAQLWAESHTRGDRNLSNITSAREAYEEFSLRFPNHKSVGEAKTEAGKMKSLLVQQELEVGRYYLERSREYVPAIFCFEDVIRQKNINPEAAKEAEALLERARAASAPKS